MNKFVSLVLSIPLLASVSFADPTDPHIDANKDLDMGGHNIINAGNIDSGGATYTPLDSSDWSNPPPTTIVQGLDKLANDKVNVNSSAAVFEGATTPVGNIDCQQPQCLFIQTTSPLLVWATYTTGTGGWEIVSSATNANAVINTPSGGIIATNVQAALDELDSETVKSATAAQIFLHPGSPAGVDNCVTGKCIALNTTDNSAWYASTTGTSGWKSATVINGMQKLNTNNMCSNISATHTDGDLCFRTNTQELLINKTDGGLTNVFATVAQGFIANCQATMHRGDPVWVSGYGGGGIRLIGPLLSNPDYIGTAFVGLIDRNCTTGQDVVVLPPGTEIEGQNDGAGPECVSGACFIDTDDGDGIDLAGEPICAAETAGAHNYVVGLNDCFALTNPIVIGQLSSKHNTLGKIQIGGGTASLPTQHILHVSASAMDWGTTAPTGNDNFSGNCLSKSGGTTCDKVSAWFGINPNHILYIDPLSNCEVQTWNATQNVSIRIQADPDDAANGWITEPTVPTLVINAATADYTEKYFVPTGYSWWGTRRLRFPGWEASNDTTATNEILCTIIYRN